MQSLANKGIGKRGITLLKTALSLKKESFKTISKSAHDYISVQVDKKSRWKYTLNGLHLTEVSTIDRNKFRYLLKGAVISRKRVGKNINGHCTSTRSESSVQATQQCLPNETQAKVNKWLRNQHYCCSHTFLSLIFWQLAAHLAPIF